MHAREAVSRQLRPSNSDPGRSSHEVPEAPHEWRPGWMEQGRAELEALLNSNKPEPPTPSLRSVTPVKPRIVYPYSPGRKTEIRPPPLRGSPKRNARTSPSPPRSPPPPPYSQDRNTQEPRSEVQQLAEMIGEVIKNAKGSDNKVEDVKTIPELPKLEIKDSERELSPLIAGDWVTVIGPSLRDLSSNATQWWDEVIRVSKEFYDKWLTVGPMER